ncbi:unnamed protein product [Effrenium voratum]|uniref:Nocturnin n=1 Tax=Effrenium voratum TaxID=2562239 RepID=A0AA36NIM9_9DINO|nr:unnamed protein product [Effrenium voratum]
MTFQAARRARLKELQVSDECIKSSFWQGCPPKGGTTEKAEPVRVLMYNVLADAMSCDGFLVKPVLADWPAAPGHVPTCDGGAEAPFEELLKEMLAAKADVSKLEECKKKYNREESVKNLNAVVDWQARKLQMMCIIDCFSPDVLVFAELDHYDQFLPLLRELGYESQLESCKKDHPQYRPAHLDSFCDKDEALRKDFEKEWSARGFGFFPHLASASMHVHMQRTGLGRKILETLDPKLCEKLTDKKKGGLARTWYQKVPRGMSEQLLEKAGAMPTSLDDMGVAIFWKSSRFEAHELKVQSFPLGGKGLLQVTLQDQQSKRKFSVIGCHLSSGDSAKDEEGRLTEEVLCPGGLLEAVHDVKAAGQGLILCTDSNSHPQITAAETEGSCWKHLRRGAGASVWDDFFDESGNPLTKDALDPPVTSNKVRGPLSEQAAKIGTHAYYLIDHIFFSPASFRMLQHAYVPQRFPTSEANVAALEEVQPSLHNPSDHYPVIADLAWEAETF